MIVYASDKTGEREVSHWPEQETVESESGHTQPRVSLDKTSDDEYYWGLHFRSYSTHDMGHW